MFAKLILWAIRNVRFSPEDRTLVMASLIKKFGAIDLNGVIRIGEGRVYVRGMPLSAEQSISLSQSAEAMKTSIARRFVREQVLSEAVNIGFTSAKAFDQVEFARAAVWFGTREEELYEALAEL